MFLQINGVTVRVEYGSWREDAVEVGELSARTLALRPARARGGKVRRWTFRTVPTEMSASEMEKLADWIEGIGQSWKFDNSLFSGNGVQKTASGTTTAAATGGKFGGKVTIASASKFGVKMSNKLGVTGGWLPTIRGWSLLARRKFLVSESAASGWRDLLLSGAVAFTRGSAANPTGVTQYVDGVAAPTANLGRCFSVATSDPYTGLHGYKTDNTASDIDFDDFAFYPFQIPASWVAGIASWRALYSWSALPRVKVWGDVFNDGGRDFAPVECVGTVTSKEVTQVCEGSVVKNTLRSLTVTLEEWATQTSAIEEPLAEPTGGALFTFDPDDLATLVITTSPQIDRANDATPNASPPSRYFREDNGLVAFDGMDRVTAATPSGRAAASCGNSGGVTTGYFGCRWDDGAATLIDNTGKWFTGTTGAAIPTLTRFIALKINSAPTSATPFSNSGCDWIFDAGGTGHHLGLSVRADGGVTKLGFIVRDGAPSSQSIEVDISALVGVWFVAVMRKRSGFIDISTDGGVTWTSQAVTGSIENAANQYIGANYSSARGFDGRIAHLRDYSAALTDAEVIATSEYIDGLVNG